jgi:hypothetical protein
MRKIYLRFMNGLSFAAGVRDILSPLASEYEFVESNDPEFVIFGPYGSAVPPAGGPVRVGYFCENLIPDMSVCDWAFGNRYEEDVGDPRYVRIQWHGVDPVELVRPPVHDPARLLEGKTGFCNFIYANPVPYRERFFRALSRYKRVDAPGRSMNNMASIDTDPTGDFWETKRRFLRSYKFTIAFENYSFPGYNTEKLLDPMLAGSLPVYFGNALIGRHFNTRSFLNGHEFTTGRFDSICGALESRSQASFREVRSPMDVPARLRRKLKGLAQAAKMRLQTWDFEPLIEQIIRMDRDDGLYLSYATQPWFEGNVPPSNEKVLRHWRTIFSGGTQPTGTDPGEGA